MAIPKAQIGVIFYYAWTRSKLFQVRDSHRASSDQMLSTAWALTGNNSGDKIWSNTKELVATHVTVDGTSESLVALLGKLSA